MTSGRFSVAKRWLSAAIETFTVAVFSCLVLISQRFGPCQRVCERLGNRSRSFQLHRRVGGRLLDAFWVRVQLTLADQLKHLRGCQALFGNELLRGAHVAVQIRVLSAHVSAPIEVF